MCVVIYSLSLTYPKTAKQQAGKKVESFKSHKKVKSEKWERDKKIATANSSSKTTSVGTDCNKTSTFNMAYWHLLDASVALLVSLCQSEIHSCSGSHSEPRGHCRRRQIQSTCLNWWLYRWRLWLRLRCRKGQTSELDRGQWRRWEGGRWTGWRPRDLQGRGLDDDIIMTSYICIYAKQWLPHA